MVHLLICLSLFVHPFHVSVYEINHSKEDKSIQITCRIFIDDLEKGLRKENGNDQLDIMKDSLLVHTTNKLYINKNLHFKVNGKETDYRYLGGEIEVDVMWVYLEINGVTNLSTIDIDNSILTDIYDDQQNMVHFKIDGLKRSFILTEEKGKARFENR